VFAAHVGLYRLLRGRLVGRNTLILTTVGRRSGRKRSTPLFFVHDGADYVVIASNGGEDRYPGWWHNIRSNPDIEIEVGARTIACRAEKAKDDDVPRLWGKLTAVHRGYAKYRERTRRELTILRLRPRLDEVVRGRSHGEGR
jgi:deazaflavin-dependent oxidoreductase (nitroreductase family)